MKCLAVCLTLLVVSAAAGSGAQSRSEIPATTSSDEARQHYQNGLSLSENSRHAEAAQELSRALRLDPDFASARAVLAFHTPGPAALKELDRASQQSIRLPEAERVFIETLRATRRGDAQGAVTRARRLVELLPDAPRAHAALGQALFRMHDYTGAATESRKAVQLNPRHGPALNILGYAMLQQGKTAEAIDAFRKYASVLPQEPNPMDSLGDALLAAGRYAEAETAFRKAVEISPKFWNGFEGIACARFYQGDFAGAREAFEQGRTVAERPTDRATLEQVAAFEALAENRPDDAMKVLDDIERIPNIAADHTAMLPVARAMVHLHRGHTRAALVELDEALGLAARGSLPPPLAAALKRYTLTVRVAVEAAMTDVGASATTVKMLQKDAAEHPNDPMLQSSVQFAMGMAALAKGDRAAALAHWAECSTEDTLCQGYLAMNGPARAPASPRDPVYLYLSSRRPLIPR